MKVNCFVAASLLAFALVGVAACSNGKATVSSTAKSTRPNPADESTTSASGGSPTTIPKVAFDDGVAQVEAALDAAGDDPCKLLALLTESAAIQDPLTPEQAKVAVGVFVDVLTAIADAAPSKLSAEAQSIRTGVSQVQDEAEAAGYDPQALKDGLSAFDDPKFIAAMTAYNNSVSEQCGSAGLGGGTSGG